MSTKKPAAQAPRRALDLGVLQSNLEAATKQRKTTAMALMRASEADLRAEAEYDACKKALAAGVAQLTAATKV